MPGRNNSVKGVPAWVGVALVVLAVAALVWLAGRRCRESYVSWNPDPLSGCQDRYALVLDNSPWKSRRNIQLAVVTERGESTVNYRPEPQENHPQGIWNARKGQLWNVRVGFLPNGQTDVCQGSTPTFFRAKCPPASEKNNHPVCMSRPL